MSKEGVSSGFDLLWRLEGAGVGGRGGNAPLACCRMRFSYAVLSFENSVYAST